MLKIIGADDAMGSFSLAGKFLNGGYGHSPELPNTF